MKVNGRWGRVGIRMKIKRVCKFGIWNLNFEIRKAEFEKWKVGREREGERGPVEGGPAPPKATQALRGAGGRFDSSNPASMVPHMKTTIDIASPILRRAKRVAGEEGVTLRELAEEGLEMALQKRAARKVKGFRLVTFGDPEGEPVSIDWEALRGLVYPA